MTAAEPVTAYFRRKHPLGETTILERILVEEWEGAWCVRESGRDTMAYLEKALFERVYWIKGENVWRSYTPYD